MITPKKLTICEAFNNSRVAYSDRPALSFIGNTPINYAELAVVVKNLSGMLITAGIGRGDKVALIGENSPNWSMAYLSIATIGAVVVPILPDFSSEEMKNIIEHSEAKVVFASAKIIDRLNISSLNNVSCFILLNNLLPIDEQTYQSSDNQEYIIPTPVENAALCSFDFPQPEEDDLIAIIYTSGTTGRPKGVMLTHKNIVSNIIATYQIQEMNSTDRLLSILPLPHTYECTIGLLMAMTTGAAVYYLDKAPTPTVLLPAMQSIKPTMMLVVPLVIEKIYKNKIRPELTSSRLKRALYGFAPTRKLLHRIAARKLYQSFGGKLHFFGIGGAKLSYDTERFLFEGKFPYSVGYGLTETSPLLSGNTPKITRFRCAGYNLPGQEMKIHNPDPLTGEGEILARGSNVMVGYYKEPQFTKDVFIDGWFRTGDLGAFDKHGYIQILGRSKNMILSPSGENIYPEEIEEVINKHELVVESLVYELKGKLMARVHLNKVLIEQYAASVPESKKEFQKTAKDLQSSVEEYSRKVMGDILTSVNTRVARFSKLSAVVEQVEPFEKTPTQKIKRFIYKDKQE